MGENLPANSDEGEKVYACIEGLNPEARNALCNSPCSVTHLPWVFGSFAGPKSVTDIFCNKKNADVILTDSCNALRQRHIQIESAEGGGLQLHLMRHGDFCEFDEDRIGAGTTPLAVPLTPGSHTLRFGHATALYTFSLQV